MKGYKFLFSLLTILSLVTLVGSQGLLDNREDKIQIRQGESEWVTAHSTDEDLFVYSGEKNKQKSEICLLSRTATKQNDLEQHKNIYDERGNLLAQLNRETVRERDSGLERDYYGYCRLVDSDDERYLKFGEASTYVVYQNLSQVDFEIESGKFVTAIIEKNVSGEFERTPNDIFIDFNEPKWKFGAEDIYNNNLSEYEHYRYTLVSDVGMKYLKGKYLWGATSDGGFYWSDFSDICNKENANCSFNRWINKTDITFHLEVDFYSNDGDIDPTYQFVDSVEDSSYLQNISVIANLSILQPNDNMYAYFPFDLDDNVTAYDWRNRAGDDRSTEDYDGTYTGAVTGSGYHNGGAYFDGINDFIQVGTAKEFEDLCVGGCSFSTWVNLTGSGVRTLTARWRGSGEDRFFLWRVVTDNTISFLLYENGNTAPVCEAESTATVPEDTWQLLTAVFNESDAFLYINDTQVATTKAGAGTCVPVNIGLNGWGDSEQTYIGKRPDTNFFSGHMDDFTFWNKSLSQAEITDLFNNNTAVFLTQGEQQLPPFESVGVGNNSVNVSITSINLRDSSGNVSVRLGEWEEGNGYNPTLLPNLLGYWRLDESSYDGTSGEVKDVTGLYNGTAVGGATTSTRGKFYNSSVLDGSNDWLNISDPNNEFDSVYPLTISAWINTSEPMDSTIRPIFANDYHAPGGFPVFAPNIAGYSLFLESNKLKFDFAITTSDINFFISTDLPTINDSQWHHILLTIEENKYKGDVGMWIDGVDYSAQEIGLTDQVPSYGFDTEVKIGSGWDMGFGVEGFWTGDIDEVMVFNRHFPPNDVRQLYHQGRLNYTFTNSTLISSANTNYTVTIKNTTTKILPNFRLQTSDELYTPLVDVVDSTYDFWDVVSVVAAVINFAFLVVGFGGISFAFLFLAFFIFNDSKWVIKLFLYSLCLLSALVMVASFAVISEIANVTILANAVFILTVTSVSVFFLYIMVYGTMVTIKALKEAKESRKTDMDKIN